MIDVTINQAPVHLFSYMKITAGIGLIFMIVIVSCGNVEKGNDSDVVPGKVTLSGSDQLALNKMESLCYACHSPRTASHDDILAPPFAGVRNRYKVRYSDKESFTKAMASFIMEPTESKALMFGAVAQFNVMLPLVVDSTTAYAIASYMYDHEPEKPSWFDEHYNEMHGGSQ